MRIAMFYHSLASDWNHGNAHFLRGIVTELQALGHEIRVLVPVGCWSEQNLVRDHGGAALAAFEAAYPNLSCTRYDGSSCDLDALLGGADLVLVHEWNDADLVARIGRHRASRGRYRLLFHDTHHRSATQPAAMAAYDLTQYDGVLAFGQVVRDRYLGQGWAKRAWVWHEAADARIFHPRPRSQFQGDVVWIGNWGDEERTEELHAYLIEPIRRLRLRATFYGVRYPTKAVDALARAGIHYAGYLPNHRVPEVFSRYRLTVHVPRRPYVEALPGIPTIRPFEAMACGIPLICAPWNDSEGLFTPGRDYLVAADGAAMIEHMRRLLRDPAAAATQAAEARETILRRHTCRHRTAELMAIAAELGIDTATPRPQAPKPARPARSDIAAPAAPPIPFGGMS